MNLTPRSRQVWCAHVRARTNAATVGRMLGVSPGKARSIVAGRSHVTVDQARAVLEGLGVELVDVGRNAFTLRGLQ